jgi:hypothetical protein
MKFNKWTLALAALGVVSLGSVAQAEEAKAQVLTAVSQTTLSGYIDTSAIWQFGNRTTSAGRSYDAADKQDGFNVNVVQLSLSKPLDEGGWAAGYQADLLFGPDANGFRNGANDFAIEQAYVNLRAPVGNGLDIKMGAFTSVIGYESFDSYKNPNYSRSYGYFVEPLQHTGLLASYQVAEWMKVSAGIANSCNANGINGRSQNHSGVVSQTKKTFMGSVALTAPESMGWLKGASLYGGVVNGFDVSLVNKGNSVSWYGGLYLPTPVTDLGVGFAYDYRGQDADWTGATPDVLRAANTYANAMSAYVTYKATDKMSLANRLEYASGSAGTWTTSARSQEFLADTFTLDYSLWQNVVTRGEFRWDRDLTGQGLMADTGKQFNALSLALNVIYKF